MRLSRERERSLAPPAVSYDCRLALLAQLVEHFHGKEGVNGSSPLEGLGAIAPRATVAHPR